METKDARLELRLTAEQKALFQKAADRDGRPLSNWVRERLLRIAREEVGEITGGKGRGKRRPSP